MPAPRHTSVLFSVLSLGLAATTPALAQEDEARTEEIVVTSSRIPLPLRQIGTSVSVMTESMLEAHGNPALTDVLRQMPAVGASGGGGVGKTTTVRIRGEEGFRTLTVLDGMRLQDASAPQITTDFAHLLTAGIGRIEILRGPQGLTYGADAGGVIDLRTRRVDEGFIFNLDGQAGEHGTRDYSGYVAGGGDRVDYFLSATDFGTDGFNAQTADSVLRDADGYDNTTLHGRLGVELSQAWRLELVHRDIDSRNEADGCFDSATFMTVHACSNDYALSASRIGVEYGGDAFTHSLSYTGTESERQNYTAGVPSFGAVGEQTRWEYIGSATALPGFDLVFGADRQEDISNGSGRDNVGYFLEYLSDFSEQVFFTAGVRHDDNDDFGTNTSFRLSGAYLLDLAGGTLKFKGALGTGFRAPSPFEIQYNDGPSAFPPAANTVLSQEESAGWEAGVEYLAGTLRLEAVYFDQEVEDAIFFDLANFSGYLQDVGTSHSRGVELTAEAPLTAGLRVTGNYTYNDTERPDGSQRLRRPEHLVNAGLMYSGLAGRLDINGFYRYQTDAIDFGGPLQDFGVFDLTAFYQVSDAVRVYGRIENLFDEEYEEILGFNTAGRTAFVGVNLRLGSE